jgi:hypothetical protein
VRRTPIDASVILIEAKDPMYGWIACGPARSFKRTLASGYFFAAASTSSYNSGNRRASSEEFPKRADS